MMKFISFLKDTWSELRKVHWLSFKELMKNTGIVVATIILFTLLFAGFDWLIANGLSLVGLY